MQWRCQAVVHKYGKPGLICRSRKLKFFYQDTSAQITLFLNCSSSFCMEQCWVLYWPAVTSDSVLLYRASSPSHLFCLICLNVWGWFGKRLLYFSWKLLFRLDWKVKFCSVRGAAWFVRRRPLKLEIPTWTAQGRMGFMWCVAEQCAFSRAAEIQVIVCHPKRVSASP